MSDAASAAILACTLSSNLCVCVCVCLCVRVCVLKEWAMIEVGILVMCTVRVKVLC